MRRVSVVGNSGSGKTALAAALATKLGVPHIELDAIFHLPQWVDLPEEEFRHQVSVAVAREGWVIDGNYAAVVDLVWRRADTVVWLDLPRPVVMYRVVSRTLRRVVLRKTLWNGNREPWSNLYSLDPMKSIVAWAWTRHGVYRTRYAAASTDPDWQDLTFVRLRTRRDVRELIGR